MKQQVRAFTCEAEGIVNVLRTNVHIGEAFDPSTGPVPGNVREYVAIWDTGATNTIISEKVVKECGFFPISRVTVCTAGSTAEDERNVYFVSVGLPNKVRFPAVKVTDAVRISGADVLVGMDIIGLGDFAASSFGGKTTFTFRMPACQKFDFAGDAAKQEHVPFVSSTPKVGRNDPCPCGSGRKYKSCHWGRELPTRPGESK